MNEEKNKNKKKKTQVVKEQDVIKDSDYEDSNDNKKIIIVALILALLIGTFAYVRSMEEKDKGNGDEEIIDKETDDKDDEDESPVVEENTTNTENNYQPTTTPSTTEEVVDIWKELNNIPSTVEAGEEVILPEITTTDDDKEIKAVVTYKYRTNSDLEYTTVDELDTTKIGEYVVTYTLSYTDGKVETKEVTVTVSDTTEPVINNVTDGSYYNEDILLDITEYSPYTVELNGEEYDITNPITIDGEYTLVVTEDSELGSSIKVTFVIDKSLPEITAVENEGTYTVNVTDANLDTIVVTKDGEEISFANGVTVLSEEGTYEVVATDKAGNSNTYTLVIDVTAPIVEVSYTPDNSELTNSSVLVTITSNEALQEIEGWTLSEDKLTLTKEFTQNETLTLEVKDLNGNTVNVDIVVDYIDYNVSYAPKLTLENLVANKVKATITSLNQLKLNDEWVEIIEAGTYKYEKIYSESGVEEVTYEDMDGNTGTIVVNIDITLNDAFVTYVQDEVTQNVKAYVVTAEEVANLPEGWVKDDEYMASDFRYYKEYIENVEYEMVEFVTDSNTYVATIVIDSIDRTAPAVEADVTYVNENDEKTSVVVVVSADEEITSVEGWSLSEDKKSILKIVDRPADVTEEDINEKVTITDLKGNTTEVEYTYNWN